MIKDSVHRKHITIINAYAFNKGDSKYMKHKLTELKEELDISRMIVEDF